MVGMRRVSGTAVAWWDCGESLGQQWYGGTEESHTNRI